MKHQSLKAVSFYWDLYDAMGGKIQCLHGLIMGLLVKIMFIFSTKGASKASQLFYNAFISAYKDWELNSFTEKNKKDVP